MRKIRSPEIFTFATLLTVIFLLALATTWLAGTLLPVGDLRGVSLLLIGVFLVYVYAFAAYRLFLSEYPLNEGEIAVGSREEYGYHVYLLFNLILFYPLTRSNVVPVPLMRLVYQLLGARLGDNSYSSGILFDPPLVSMGANCIVGQSALLIPHVIEGQHLAHWRIELGDDVTIGANAVVLAGVTIGDRAIVAIGAVVAKGSVIGPDEIWGGIPARNLRTNSLSSH